MAHGPLVFNCSEKKNSITNNPSEFIDCRNKVWLATDLPAEVILANDPFGNQVRMKTF